jgi:hypothetical protein
MTHTNSTPANPTPPGWPDPLESPQAEAIRNGKLDDTEIRNLFDCMERELRLHRERAANPAQGVSEVLREALNFVNEASGAALGIAMSGSDHPNPDEVLMDLSRKGMDLAPRLTAAIGAAPKNDASASIAEMRQTAKELRENANGDCNAARQAIYWDGKADALEAAIGAGGQAVAWQYTAVIDDDGTERRERRIATNPDYIADLDPVAREVVPLYAHPVLSGQAVADLTYGKKLIAEAITHHFGERDERYDEYEGDTTVQDVWEAFDALTAIAPVQPGWRPTHRHVKRGSKYMLLGIGKMQTSNWMDEQWSHEPQSGNPPQRTLDPVDMREVAIYRAEDGQFWVRPREEFEDGRFDTLPAAPQPKGDA